MKIFLTGASGLVGAAFAAAAAQRGHTVIGTVGRFPNPIPGLAEQAQADLLNRDVVTRLVLDAFPEAIVNCAAISEPAACEADPTGSERMNVELPATLAELARHLHARLLHLSSEQVFDGERAAPYSVTDPPSPINTYGRQKVASERAVLSTAPTLAAVVRAPLLMGDSPGGRRSVHERLLGDWAAGRTARLYTDEFRQPCTATSLADVLLELVERPEACGAFHWAGAELLSRHELGRRLREHFKLRDADAPIVAVTRAEAPETARQRHACLALDLAPLPGRLKARPQSLAEQLTTLKVPPPVRDWYRSL
ncbi:MAG TPA: SDR family oxidoreductase [Opitutus sp.]|nr:SDR family oxidoreductase [Opitutus sp.]